MSSHLGPLSTDLSTSSGPSTSSLPLEIAGETFQFYSNRAFEWRAKKTVVISDLHLGKAETFLQNGLWLPQSAQHEDLAELRELILKTDSTRLLILGDLIHTAKGMSSELIHEFGAWCNGIKAESNTDVIVTTGNHDQHFVKNRWPEEWSSIITRDSLVENEILFQHEPASDGAGLTHKFVWYGHLHPAVQLDDGVTRSRHPCFYIKKTVGFLPAFSSLAGAETIRVGKSEIALPTDRQSNWIGKLEK